MRVLIVIPALNEAKIIAATVQAVRRFADTSLAGHDVRVVVADNGSTDGTDSIVADLAATDASVGLHRLDQRGKGLAVRSAWQAHEAADAGMTDAFVFMDADLAVKLEALPALLRALQDGASIAVGSRYHPESEVRRTPLRRFFSRGYRALLGAALETGVSDMPCGFKAVNAQVVKDILPQVRDNRWFFDTELVVRAERAGHRIAEVPVSWSDPEGRTSKVRVFALAKEYAQKVYELQCELGPRDFGVPRASIASLRASVTRREWLMIAGAAGVIALLGLLPPIIGMLWGREHGTVWNGRQYLSPGDFSVYLSYIVQAQRGELLFANAATTEPLVPVFNWLWLFVGWLGKPFLLTPIASYHAARTLLILPLAATVYLGIAHFLRGKAARATAFILAMFGSGVGLYVAPFLKNVRMGWAEHQWPIDFWVSEANLFMSAIYSPHFVASWALFIAALVLLCMAYDAERPKYGIYAGLAALALFLFHPFHAPTLWLVSAVTLALYTRTDGYRIRRVIAGAFFIGVSSPAVLYHYWLTHWTANARFMLDNNENPSPWLPLVLVGFGLCSVLAVVGWWTERSGRTRLLSTSSRRFLAGWAVAQLALCYAPFIFQRRLLEGLQYPLVILSVPAIALILQKAIRKPYRVTLVAVFAAILLFPSTFATIDRGVQAARAAPGTPFFFSREHSAALTWLREQTPTDAIVFCIGDTGNEVIGWGERTAYVGHWANTIDLGRKQYEVREFFVSMTDQQRRAFVSEHGIDYVLVGPRERRYGGNLEPSRAWLWREFSQGGYEIYKVTLTP